MVRFCLCVKATAPRFQQVLTSHTIFFIFFYTQQPSTVFHFVFVSIPQIKDCSHKVPNVFSLPTLETSGRETDVARAYDVPNLPLTPASAAHRGTMTTTLWVQC